VYIIILMTPNPKERERGKEVKRRRKRKWRRKGKLLDLWIRHPDTTRGHWKSRYHGSG
jgi:hypothetical protein